MAEQSRSEEAKQWQWMYSTTRWFRLREQVWVRDMGMCAYCNTLIIGMFHCDHIEPHKGNEALMWNIRNLQLLHPRCHNSLKQSFELNGYVKGCDVNGIPVDKNHPWSRSKQ
jgi:5-methylcytosine-specific restriction endonuclease McrA